MEPEGSLPHSQVPATCPYPEPDQSSPCPQSLHTTSWRSFLIISSHLRLGLPSGLSLRSLHQNAVYIALSLFSPYVLHAPPVSFFSIWWPEQCSVRYRSLSSSLCALIYTSTHRYIISAVMSLNTIFRSLCLTNHELCKKNPKFSRQRLIYIIHNDSFRTSQRTHCASIWKTSRWMLCRGKYSLFIVRTVLNTYMPHVHKIQSF